MPRARNIKWGFYTNDILAETDPYTRLLFPALWMLADKNGRLEYRPKRLKAQVFPYEDVDIEKCINQLISRNFAILYEISGNLYIEIPNFTKHQNPHKNEQDTDIPSSKDGTVIKSNGSGGSGGDSSNFMKFHERSGNANPLNQTAKTSDSPEQVGDSSMKIDDSIVDAQETSNSLNSKDSSNFMKFQGMQHTTRADSLLLIPDSLSLNPDSLNPESITGEVSPDPSCASDGETQIEPDDGELEQEPEPEGFVEFWLAYPKKKSKEPARKAWKKANAHESKKLRLKIMEGLELAKKSEDWLKSKGQFVPYPASWLNAKGWEDEYEDFGLPDLGVSKQAQKEARNEIERQKWIQSKLQGASSPNGQTIDGEVIYAQ